MEGNSPQMLAALTGGTAPLRQPLSSASNFVVGADSGFGQRGSCSTLSMSFQMVVRLQERPAVGKCPIRLFERVEATECAAPEPSRSGFFNGATSRCQKARGGSLSRLAASAHESGRRGRRGSRAVWHESGTRPWPNRGADPALRCEVLFDLFTSRSTLQYRKVGGGNNTEHRTADRVCDLLSHLNGSRRIFAPAQYECCSGDSRQIMRESRAPSARHAAACTRESVRSKMAAASEVRSGRCSGRHS